MEKKEPFMGIAYLNGKALVMTKSPRLNMVQSEEHVMLTLREVESVYAKLNRLLKQQSDSPKTSERIRKRDAYKHLLDQYRAWRRGLKLDDE